MMGNLKKKKKKKLGSAWLNKPQTGIKQNAKKEIAAAF